MVRGLVALLIVVSGATTAVAQSDPFIGVWKVNPDKSTYEAGRPPRSFTRTYEDRGGGTILLTVDSVSAAGAAARVLVVYKRDNKPYPESTTGARSLRMIAVRAVDNFTEEVAIVGAAADGTNTLMVSRDRKTLTQIMKGVTPDGRPYTNIVVYEKQ